MGLFSFIKEAGEKLFGAKEVEQAAASNAPNVADLNKQAGDAINKPADDLLGLLESISTTKAGVAALDALNAQLADAEPFEVRLRKFTEDVVRDAFRREGVQEMLQMRGFESGFKSLVHKFKHFAQGGSR